MDPLLTVECERFVPDRFALVLAAASRTRALGRGAEPRVPAVTAPSYELAFREIAAGAFCAREIDELLLAPWQAPEDAPPVDPPDRAERRGGHSDRPAAVATIPRLQPWPSQKQQKGE